MSEAQAARKLSAAERDLADRVAEEVTDNIVTTMRDEPRSEWLATWPTKRQAVLAHRDTAHELYEARGGDWRPDVWRYIVATVLETSLSATPWPSRRKAGTARMFGLFAG